MIRHRLVASLASIACLATLLASPGAMAQSEPTTVDKAFDLYWGKKRDIRVIQKRLFLKESRWEISLLTGIVPNDDFWMYFPLGGGIAHFFSEDVGVELSGAYILSTNSDLKDFLQNNGLDVDLPQSLMWRAGINGLWSPFHGKVGLFTSKLLHFDFSAIFGVGAIGTNVLDPYTRQEKGKVDISGNAGAGFRVWLSETVALRLEYRHYFYPAEGGGVSLPAEFSLALSFFTTGPE